MVDRATNRRLLFLMAAFVAFASHLSAIAATKTSAVVKRAVRSVGLVSSCDPDGTLLAQGSGFIVTARGAFVTNYHVVVNASVVKVRFPSGREYFIEGYLAIDEENDLVLLKIPGANQPFLHIARTPPPEIGDDVIAIGSPLGFEASVSTGIVSGFRPSTAGQTYFIQTTAPISPGSSGGPLLDSSGNVVGVTNAQASGGQNINFAIPAEQVLNLFKIASDSPRPIGAMLLVHIGDQVTKGELTARYGAPSRYDSAVINGVVYEEFTYANVIIQTSNHVVSGLWPTGRE